MRICLISERLSPPYDEGIKNYAWQLTRALSQGHETLTLTAFCDEPERLDETVHQVRTNRLFLSGKMAHALRSFAPNLVLYVPTACATLASFCRARVLQAMVGRAPVVMISLQWRPITGLARRLMPLVRPRLVLTQSQVTAGSLSGLGCRTALLPPQVDTTAFAPVDDATRRQLRLKYDLDTDTRIVLHVGHLNAGRNIQAMAQIKCCLDVQTLVVGSSSTPHDRMLVESMRSAGVFVIDRYVPDVAELYQLADCYLFPVQAAMSAIDLPLSVLEAMACNLPVVTTRHAGLLSLFDETPGLVYADSVDEMVEGVRCMLAVTAVNTRTRVIPFGADSIAQRLLAVIDRDLLELRTP